MIVESATDKDIARFYGFRINVPWEGFVARRGDLIVGAGGVVVGDSGRIRAFLDLGKWSRKPMAFRYVITYLAELRDRGIDEIEATCDMCIPKADKFLRRLGFEPTGEYEGNMEVWKWRA